MVTHDRHISSWVRKYGINVDVDGAEDIIAAGGDQYWPAAAIVGADIDIASSSAEDGAGGETGALTIQIEGVDADGMTQSELVTLNGTTDVHPAGPYFRIHRASVISVGSVGRNVGTITIDDGIGTLAIIPVLSGIGYGQTEQATYTIPKDWKYGWVRDFHVSMAGTPTGLTDLAAGYLEARNSPTESWRVIENWQVEQSKDFDLNPPEKWPGIRLPAGADVRLRIAAVSNTDTAIAGSFYIELE